MGISLQRILTGFVIGSAMAAPAGLLLGSVRTVRALFDPYTQFFRFVPSIAWLTPVVLWFGIGEISKVLIIIYTTTFIVLINTMVGVSHIAPNKLRVAACPWGHTHQGVSACDAPSHLAVHSDGHAPGDGKFVCHRGFARDDCGGHRPRLPHL
jgi:ABC-type proline/glycine betaine transport system permease subunit